MSESNQPQGKKPEGPGVPQGKKPAGPPKGKKPVGPPKGKKPAGPPSGRKPAGLPGAPKGRKPAGPPGVSAKKPGGPKLPPRHKVGPPGSGLGGDGASVLTRQDFSSDQDVRWCPGCGDYAILATVQRLMPELGVPREDVVFISGIGCSSRFPYYMDTYGMHSIHGRAPTIATGLKASRPELDVWIITGDGDGLSIGGNHLIHLMRRNVNVQLLLFNNQIYGLTKGQYSPTSEEGKITKSTPFGSIDHPFNPIALVQGADATFVARTMDRDPKHMKKILKRSHDHHGTGFVEIYQNCNIFNDGAFFEYTEKATKSDRVVFVDHGEPLVYAGGKRGLRLDGFRLKSIDLESGDWSVDDCLVYDETSSELASIISRVYWNRTLPQPFGVIYREDRPTYEEQLHAQVDAVLDRSGEGSLKELLHKGETWVVE